jgi:hypothetical protein
LGVHISARDRIVVGLWNGLVSLMENLSWHAVPKNLTRKSIESRVDDFIYVVARKDFLKDFLDDGENLPEEDSYFILRMDDILKQRTQI